MDKRYQVFISSTFADLEEERKEVMEAIINLDCFPAGMEMFPAADIEQFEYIKTIIDQSDYYILVIAGRYGSLAGDGISYTEKEYEYAREKGIPVLVFVKKDIESIPYNKTDNNPKMKEKLVEFRKKVMESRLAKLWDEKLELKYMVHDSLSKTIKMNPREGWVRGNIPASSTVLLEIENIRKEKEKLEEEIKILKAKNIEIKKRKEIAQGEDLFKVPFWIYTYDMEKYEDSINMSWEDIFMIVAEKVKDDMVDDEYIKEYIEDEIIERIDKECNELYISDRIYTTIKYQLEALELIEIDSSDIVLSEKGKKEYRNKLIVKKNSF